MKKSKSEKKFKDFKQFKADMQGKTNGLTFRWIINFLFSSFIILLIIFVVYIFLIVYYFYGVADDEMNNAVDSAVNSFDVFYQKNDSPTHNDIVTLANNLVMNFSKKDKMEIWVIEDGQPKLSSSGFDVTKKTVNDWNKLTEEFFASADPGKSVNKSPEVKKEKNENGETVLYCYVFAGNKDSNTALKFMMSTMLIDDQALTLSVYGFFVMLLILAIIVVSGLYFIRSIIVPIRAMSDATRSYAAGDFSVKLDSFDSNELDELGEAIQYMIKEIQDADRMKSEFVSTISHELRTPLTAIKGWGETILQIGPSDQELTKKGMSVIINESQRLSELVEELLDFSRIQKGTMKLRIEKIDILAELDETIFVFRDRATREGIELTYNAPDVPAPMLGDANRITQVFTNILDNAIKYNKQGGSVSVIAKISEEDDLIEVTFSDTGCGIPKEAIPRVKEKFFKINDTVRGSGIGLAVVDEIVKLHNGELIIDSVEGKGTTVKVIFPIDKSDFAKEKELNGIE